MTTNTKQTYFVEIKPIGYYFFGGERTFNTAKTDKYKKPVANYYAISNYYPQQTALLGMLRYAMLVMFNKLNEKAAAKTKYIGDSFNGLSPQNYGYIQSISPLCLLHKDGSDKTFLLPSAYSQQSDNLLVDYETQNYKSYTGSLNEPSAVLNNFKYKDFDTSIRWVDKNNKSYQPFKILERVGVKIKDAEDAFYRQKHVALNKGFSFGLWVNFAVNDFPLTNLIIPFGGDQGLSKITFHKNIPAVFDETQKPTQTILLLNDAFVEADFFKNVNYGITEFADFRYIKSKTKNYYALKNQTDKSGKMKLLKRGSVLFCKDGKAVAYSLRSNKAYRQIGYNYFKFI